MSLKAKKIILREEARSHRPLPPPSKSTSLDSPTHLQCVRCGACMEACPLYLRLGREPAVARGKLNLWGFYQEGRLPNGEVLREVLECCLLCGACTTRCAVDLPVPDLIKGARAQVRDREGRRWSPALLLAHLTWQAPHLIPALAPAAPMVNRLKVWLGSESGLVYRLLPHLAGPLGRLPDLSPTPFRARAPRFLPGRGTLKVGFFIGCGVEALFPQVGQAFLTICQRLGVEVIIPPRQGCCGLLSESIGERNLALEQGQRLVQEFASLPVDLVVTACASCSYQLKRLGQLLAETPEAQAAAHLAGKVQEASEFLVQTARYRPEPGSQPGGVVFHDPCHLHRSQGIITEPRELIQAAVGEPPREPAERVCCGLGGAFGVLYPEISQDLGAARLATLQETGAQVVATNCSGCLMQLGGLSKTLPVIHLLELLN